MSDADDAYKVAQRLIAEALEDGEDSLGFDVDETHALTTLPPEISVLTNLKVLDLDNTQIMDISSIENLTSLTVLWLNNTPITDLSPLADLSGITTLWLQNTPITDLSSLAGLTGLETLYLAHTPITDLTPLASLVNIITLDLDYTSVTDLRPLLPMLKLEKESERYGLTYIKTPVIERDPKLAELSLLENDKERARATFAYLREVGDNWPPIPETTPDQDTILTVSQTDDGRLDISPATPDADELTDTVKHKAHQLLQQATKSLEQIAGNMHPRLASTARTLSLHIDCPFKDVDMLDAHFELEALRGTYERRGERKGEDIFGDDVIDALDKVLMIGPGLVLDNEQVEKLEARRDRYRGTPPTPDVQAAQDQLSDSIALDPVLFGDTIRSYSVTFKEGHAEDSERLQAGQGILNKNTVIKAGSYIANHMVGGVIGGATLAFSTWLFLNYETISILAPTWGVAFDVWIAPIMVHAREATIAARGLLECPD